MMLFRATVFPAILLMLCTTQNTLAQASCEVALPDFTAAMRANTAEALTTYLNNHAPCFEVPARAKLGTFGGAVLEPAAANAPIPDATAQQTVPMPLAAREPVAPTGDPSCELYANARSDNSEQALEIFVTNETNVPLLVDWIDYGGERQLLGIVRAGQMIDLQTFITHPFGFTTREGVCLKIILPELGVENYVVGP